MTLRRRNLFLLALIVGSVLPALAQDASNAPSSELSAPHRHDRPEWARELTPEQDALVGQLFLERLQAIAALDRGPDRARRAREIEKRLQEKLSEFLSPEQVAGYRAGLPATLLHEPNATAAVASASCDNGYSALEQACSKAVQARDAGQLDVNLHGNPDPNPISAQEYLEGTYLKQYACEARDIAAQARTNCQLADDAASRAAQAIPHAQQQAQLATASSQYCFTYFQHTNFAADAAALAASAAVGFLEDGRDSENACFACCNPDLDAPGSIDATATTATSIRITWQDRSNEDKFVVQKSVDGGGYVTIAEKNANATQHVDSSGSKDANNRYRVAAKLSSCGLQGPWSVIAIVPKSPNNLTYVRTGSTVTLNWNDRSSLETNFEIHRKVGTAGWTVLYPGIPANVETKTGVPLGSGSNRFRVLAKTSTGKSWFTNEVTVNN
jgi:hypothetical protein